MSSRLRRVLDPAGDGGVLAGDGVVGYRLRAGAGEVDAVVFRELARLAGAAAAAGQAAAACGLYEQALGLWRGEPAGDVAVLRGHPPVTELLRRRTEAVAGYAQAACGLGWHERVIPLLEAAGRAEPLNERVHARLMVALAGTGRQAAAVAVFEGLRRRLDEELGVYPGAELAEAHQRVLRQDIPAPAVAPAAPAAAMRMLPPEAAALTGREAEPGRLVPPVKAAGLVLALWRKILPAKPPVDMSMDSFNKSPLIDFRRADLASEQLPNPFEVGLGAPLHNLPRPPVRVFVGRRTAQRLLAQALAAHREAVVTQAVYGLGGVGKSELALQHAEAHRRDYRLIWWIPASAPAQISAGLAALAEQLCPGIGAHNLTQDVAGWALSWLQAHSGWLLILDDLGDLAHAEALLGRLTGGHIILTSRRDLDWWRIADPVRLDVLDPADAAQIITLRTGYGTTADAKAAAEIADELGYLPLALDQAAAYIAQQHITPAEYLASIHRHSASTYPGTGSSGQQAIERLWNLNIEAIRNQNAGATRLLLVLAQYGSDRIPRTMLGPSDSRESTDKALGLLASYSMITLTATDVSIHRLLQAVVLKTNSEPGLSNGQARDSALDWLEASIPADPSDAATWPHMRTLLPHAEALTRRYSSADQPEQLGRVQNQIGLYHQSQADHVRALARYESALTITEKALGPEHPDTARTLFNLASVYIDLGQPYDALPLERRALAITETALGPDHPDTAKALGNLGSTYRALGQPYDALRLEQRALAITETALGPDHLDTARALGNLALSSRILGQAGDALRLERRALAITETALGPDHPDTARALGNLAATRFALGEAQDALDLERRTLAIAQKTLGSRHPTTAKALGNLGSTYRTLGRTRRALRLQRRALAITKTALGPDHPDTGKILEEMAISYKALGRLRRALKVEQRVMIINETALGPHHPDTAMTLGNLAAIFLAQRRAREALPLAQRALRTARAALGPEHPTTAVLLATVGEAWHAMGSDARSLFEQVGQIAAKAILNSQQPIAINTLRQLAASYGEAGRSATVIRSWLTSTQRDQLALAGIKLYGDGRFAWRRRPDKPG